MKFVKNNSYLLLVVMLCVIFTMIGTIKAKNNSIEYKKIVVAEGDTLWSYSKQYAANVPAHKWIQEVVEVNNLASSQLKAGEEIRIPEKKQKRLTEYPTQIAGDEKER